MCFNRLPGNQIPMTEERNALRDSITATVNSAPGTITTAMHH